MMEEDGFLTITDRLSRFSKIGGEMVPHIRIEEKLHELAGVTEQVFAVTSLPDEKEGRTHRGPHDPLGTGLAPVLEKLPQCDLPALWKPKANLFFHVRSCPCSEPARPTCGECAKRQFRWRRKPGCKRRSIVPPRSAIDVRRQSAHLLVGFRAAPADKSRMTNQFDSQSSTADLHC